MFPTSSSSSLSVPAAAPTDPGLALRRLLAEPDRWRPRLDHDPGPHAGAGPVRVLLEETADVELWLLRWAPGQGNGWHSHGDSHGAFVPVLGTLTEWVAGSTDPVRPPRIQGQRLVETGHVRTFGIPHVHHVINASPEPAVSLHAYGPALTEITRYAVVGDLLDVVEDRRLGVTR